MWAGVICLIKLACRRGQEPVGWFFVFAWSKGGRLALQDDRRNVKSESLFRQWRKPGGALGQHVTWWEELYLKTESRWVVAQNRRATVGWPRFAVCNCSG